MSSPPNPGVVLDLFDEGVDAVAACRAVAPGGLRRRLERAVAPLAARSRPWPLLLRGSGRTAR